MPGRGPYDLVADEVVNHHALWREAQWRDPENLSVQHELEYPEPYYDIVAFDRMTAGVHYGRIDMYDEDGTLIDTVPDIDPEGLHVHYGKQHAASVLLGHIPARGWARRGRGRLMGAGNPPGEIELSLTSQWEGTRRPLPPSGKARRSLPPLRRYRA